MLPDASAFARHYVNLLRSMRWDLIVHLTFPFEVTARRATDLRHKFIHMLNRQQYGQRYHKRQKRQKHCKQRNSVNWAFATERQERGAIHYHGLINGITKDTSITIPKAMNAWMKLTGGNEHSISVLPYNPALGGVEYLCKKIDDHNCPLEMGGEMPELHLQS